MLNTEVDEVLQRTKDFEQHTGMSSLDFIHSLSAPPQGLCEGLTIFHVPISSKTVTSSLFHSFSAPPLGCEGQKA
eukprot:1150144-Pelagomonas_calceolata.AAC.3